MEEERDGGEVERLKGEEENRNGASPNSQTSLQRPGLILDTPKYVCVCAVTDHGRQFHIFGTRHLLQLAELKDTPSFHTDFRGKEEGGQQQMPPSLHLGWIRQFLKGCVNEVRVSSQTVSPIEILLI